MMQEPKIREVKQGVYIRDKDIELISRLGGANLRNLISDKQVRKASKIIEDMHEEYLEEAYLEVATLFATFESFTLEQDKDSFSYEDFMNRVLDLKSMAAMFNYPLATTIAHSLYNYCEVHRFENQRELDIVRLHIVMIERIFVDLIQDDGGDLGREIVKQLRNLTS